MTTTNILRAGRNRSAGLWLPVREALGDVTLLANDVVRGGPTFEFHDEAVVFDTQHGSCYGAGDAYRQRQSAVELRIDGKTPHARDNTQAALGELSHFVVSTVDGKRGAARDGVGQPEIFAAAGQFRYA